MAALAATSSATPSLQSTMLIKSRVQQARREADQAEANAENLRMQAKEQDRVGQQARQQAQTLAKQPQIAANAAQTSTNQTSTQLQSQPTYEKTLADVFRLAKPILKTNLSGTQKNVVSDSLFTLAAETWTSKPSASVALQSYSKQVTTIAELTTGQVLNASA